MEAGQAALGGGVLKPPEHPTLVERVYRQLGWRVLLVYIACTWLICAALMALSVLGIARMERFTASQSLQAAGVTALVFVLALIPALALSSRVMRPLRVLDRGSHPTDSEGLWRRVTRMPVTVPRFNLVLVCALCAPAGAIGLAVSRPGGIDAQTVGLLIILSPCMALVVGAVAVFAAQTGLMRPVIRDVAGALNRRVPRHASLPVRTKLLLLLPAIAVSMSGCGALLGAPPGEDHSVLLRNFALEAVVALIVSLPISLALSYSLLRPLEDLLGATRRLSEADYSAPIGDVSADEYGVLAQALNDAMRGLAERQQLAEQNERLLQAVTASRARIVEASDAERRRVERNIHDGAQQRLVALALELRMLQDAATHLPPDEVQAAVGVALEHLVDASDELRELARGLNPPVLETEGLRAAVVQLALRAPVPTEANVPPGRFPRNVESAAYFVICEAIANVAKHSAASRASVTVAGDESALSITVADNGRGGASPDAGSGLTGLADRVAALGGQFSVESLPFGGTTLRARIPLGGAVSAD